MIRITLMLLVLMLLISCQLEVPGEINSSRFTIPINDPNLSKAINRQLGKNSDMPIYWEDISSLKKLEASELNISDLSGLEYFIKLSSLKLSGNQIMDISHLEKLINLDTLDLSYNQITDILPLHNLSKLTRLQLTNNRIYNLSALQNLLNLNEVYLDYNKIDAITPLKNNCTQNGLGARDYINLKFNRLDSISCVSDLNYLKAHQVKVEHDELKR